MFLALPGTWPPLIAMRFLRGETHRFTGRHPLNLTLRLRLDFFFQLGRVAGASPGAYQ
jgi:hypothetical protein